MRALLDTFFGGLVVAAWGAVALYAWHRAEPLSPETPAVCIAATEP